MRTVICLSGGIASAALLWQAVRDGHQVDAIYFDWGQPARPGELSAALALVQECPRAELTRLTVPEFCNLYCAGDSKQADYRRLAFLSLAAVHAVKHEAEQIAWGEMEYVNQQPQYDALRSFVNHLTVSAAHGLDHELGIAVPFANRRLAQVLHQAGKLGVPLEKCWSCLGPHLYQCGACRGCRRRQKAFAELGVRDHVIYGAQPDVLRFPELADDGAA